ncbi:MAG: hypothetical protein PHW69_02185 [Elusimicrobiaceae bacterium]|nr:hypothetical protein [Elusimicrobiaceae bacterium]
MATPSATPEPAPSPQTQATPLPQPSMPPRTLPPLPQRAADIAKPGQHNAERSDILFGWERLAPAPRHVPGSLAQKVRYGGFRAVFGLALLLAGCVTVFINLPLVDFQSSKFKPGNVTSGKGVVYMVQASGVKYSGTGIDKVFYVSSAEGGAPVSGICYVPRLLLTKNDLVETEHLISDPSVTRIRRTRMKPLPPGALFALPVPLALTGLLFALSGLLAGARLARLLRTGLFAEGTVTEATPFILNFGRHRIYKVTLSYEPEPGRSKTITAWARTDRPLNELAALPVLYDPRDPGGALVPGPGGITITDKGGFAPARFGFFYALLAVSAALAILLPAVYWLKNGVASPFGSI